MAAIIATAAMAALLLGTHFVMKRIKERTAALEEEIRKEDHAREITNWLDNCICYRRKLEQVNTESAKFFDTVTIRMKDAKHKLTVAENEFSEGAIAPFWDAIEQAAMLLEASKRELGSLISKHNEYREVRMAADAAFPPAREVLDLAQQRGAEIAPIPFAYDMYSLTTLYDLSTKLKELVRGAQKRFEFAMIYEQRRTNQLLDSGFANLGDALQNIGASIDSSMSDLAASMQELNKNTTEGWTRVTDQLEKMRGQAEA